MKIEIESQPDGTWNVKYGIANENNLTRQVALQRAGFFSLVEDRERKVQQQSGGSSNVARNGNSTGKS